MTLSSVFFHTGIWAVWIFLHFRKSPHSWKYSTLKRNRIVMSAVKWTVEINDNWWNNTSASLSKFFALFFGGETFHTLFRAKWKHLHWDSWTASIRDIQTAICPRFSEFRVSRASSEPPWLLSARPQKSAINPVKSLGNPAPNFCQSCVNLCVFPALGALCGG